MISRVRFSAIKPPVASTPKFSAKKRHGLVASALIAGSLLTGLAPKALAEDTKPTKPIERVLDPSENEVSAYTQLIKNYEKLSNPDEKVDFLISMIQKANQPEFKYFAVAERAVKEAVKLPTDRHKLQFILAAADVDSKFLPSYRTFILSHLQDFRLRHHTKLLIQTQIECLQLEAIIERGVETTQVAALEKLANMRKTYDQQWQALDKKLEKLNAAAEKPNKPE